MQRKPGFPHASCNIKIPDSVPSQLEALDEDSEQKRRLTLINFGHSQWGFNNWSWAVSKQDLDFVDFANGKYAAGVVAFVSVTVKSLDIHRENIGYATTSAPMKGSAIYQARKGAVTNALRETLLSFGGSVTTELLELLESQKTTDITPSVPPPPPTAPPTVHPPDPNQENNQNIPNKPTEPKNVNKQVFIPPRKDSVDSTANPNSWSPHQPAKPLLKNAVVQNPPPPVAKALPMPANLPPANKPVNPSFPANQPRPPPPLHPHPRPNSNVSFVLQPVMGGVVPPMYAPPPRVPHVPPHLYPNYYAEYSAGPWHFTYEGYDRHHGNVNLNFNIPPKNLVVNSRTGVECKNACGVRPGAEGEPIHYTGASQNQGCWIKPTIFYDGFWTEQKVKKWVAEQVEKQCPEDASHNSSSPSQSGQPDQNPKP